MAHVHDAESTRVAIAGTPFLAPQSLTTERVAFYCRSVSSGMFSGQLLRFAGAGTAATATHYGTLILLVELGRMNPTLASVIGYGGSWIVNYTLNYRFTFRSARPHRETIGRFAGVAIVAILLNSVVMATATGIGIHYLIGQVVATALVFCWTFTAQRFWIFA